MLLEENAIHVWRVRLDERARVLVSEQLPLSADELDRAKRFRFDRDRRRFVVCRTRLRQILAHYVGDDPRDLRFRYSEYGKPELCDDLNPRSIRFNVAHAGDVALIGLTLLDSIGVDVEELRQIENADDIVERCFSERETAEYRRLAAHERQRGLLNGWTRKEAFVKADGRGLSYPLSTFDVTITPEVPPRVLRVQGDSAAAGRWTMFDLEPWPRFVGAVTVERSVCRLRTWEPSDAGPA